MAGEMRRAVALAVSQQGDPLRVLGVLRPEDPADELAGLWGLPATTLASNESDLEGLRRLAHGKLGIHLTDIRVLREGRQERTGYTLEMALYEGHTSDEPHLPHEGGREGGHTYYAAWQWASADIFIEASNKGSLCTQLFLAYRAHPEGGGPLSQA